MKYYVNILNPYSPMVTRKIKEILAMNVPVDMICPSHGIIWRDNPMQIVETYQKWAANYQENQITFVYDTVRYHVGIHPPYGRVYRGRHPAG